MAYPKFSNWGMDKYPPDLGPGAGGSRMRYADPAWGREDLDMWNDYDVPGPPRAFRTGGGMADMSMGDLMSSDALNKQAGKMRSMQAQAMKLRKLGFEPQEIDVLIRGQHGLLRPEDADGFRAAMRKLGLMQRVTSIPGMAKSLRGWPGKPEEANPAAGAMEALGFGAGSMSMDELMR